MSQFRQDIITKHWVLIAPKRALRPDEFKTTDSNLDLGPATDPTCVFCPGQEKLNPDTILAIPNNKNWQIRVIPNKFEAVSDHGNFSIKHDPSDLYLTRPGIGDHEVIIMRQHNKPLALQEQSQIELAITAWLSRMGDLQNHPEVRYVHIIQNHGKTAGASVIHPHFQIFAVPFIPEHLYSELEGSASYYRNHGKCAYCAMVEQESKNGRVVLDDEDFLVFTEFASRVPFQMRIIPKRHSASFLGISVAERKSLAKVLQKTLSLVFHKLNNPPYNFYIHTMPLCWPNASFCDPNAYHWHLEVLPRTNIWAGFELGTEIYVNPVSPEDAAKILRE